MVKLVSGNSEKINIDADVFKTFAQATALTLLDYQKELDNQSLAAAQATPQNVSCSSDGGLSEYAINAGRKAFIANQVYAGLQQSFASVVEKNSVEVLNGLCAKVRTSAMCKNLNIDNDDKYKLLKVTFVARALGDKATDDETLKEAKKSKDIIKALIRFGALNYNTDERMGGIEDPTIEIVNGIRDDLIERIERAGP